jgi:hypothetical protein
MKFICQKDGNKGIVNAPDHAHAKETKPKQKDLAVVEVHVASMLQSDSHSNQ